LLEHGFQVRALVRNASKAKQLASQGVSLVVGDMGNATALEHLVSGCDAIVHGAGAVRGNCQADFDRVNVAGTAALLTAVNTQARPIRMVLLSSIVAREPQLSWYAHSKREGEKLLEQFPQLDWTVLRPPAVYGPGDTEMLPIFEWMRRGIALVPGTPDARTSLIHVSDLVSAIIACLQSASAGHKTLTLSDGTPGGYSWREIAGIARDHWSREVRLWRIPPLLLNCVAALNSGIAKVTGSLPMLTPPKLRELRHENWVADNEEITATTGWSPSLTLRKGLNRLQK
jgi:nucleoside-diphosphate-sugar epimerase